MVVVLPAPLGPRNPNTSPRYMSKEKSFTAVNAPNFLVKFSNRISTAECSEVVVIFYTIPMQFSKV